MGQKVHPIGFRLGISKPHLAVWYAERGEYRDNLLSDLRVRQLIEKELVNNAVSKIETHRRHGRLEIVVHSARPGTIIGGKGGETIKRLTKTIADSERMPVDTLSVEVRGIQKPDLDARLVAANVAQQLERRVMFRRAMRRCQQSVMREGAEGVKIMVSGRLGGAEIARSQEYRQGRVPLHQLRGNLDYGFREARTTYGVIGVKVWIFLGDETQPMPYESLGDEEGEG